MAKESSAEGFPTVDYFRERDEWEKKEYDGNDLTKSPSVASGKRHGLSWHCFLIKTIAHYSKASPHESDQEPCDLSLCQYLCGLSIVEGLLELYLPQH